MNDQNDKIVAEEKEYYALVKRVFDVLAPFYDVVTLPLSRLRNKVVGFTNASDGSKVLDIATGTGKQTFAFAKKGYDVTGIDLSEAMLKVANKKNNYQNVQFEVADATNLPFEDNSFAVSCVSFALHEMPLTIRARALKEMVRVTQPAGLLVIVDYALPRNKIGQFLIYNLIKLYEGKYYLEFIHADLAELLSKAGIEIKEECRVLFGAGRIWKGTRVSSLENSQSRA